MSDSPPVAARPRALRLVVAWVGLLAIAIVLGVWYRHGRPIEVGAVPWVGRWAFDATLLPRLVLAAAALAGATWFLPRVAAEASMRCVLAATVLVTMVLTFVLAWAGPADTQWPGLRFGYGAHTHLVDDWHGPAAFLRHYVEHQPRLTAHLRAHPPGLVLVLWLFEQIGWSSRTFHLVLMLVAGAVSSCAALAALRAVAGAPAVRAAAPFVAIGPVLVWRTNSDVLFAAVGLVAVALVVTATSQQSRRSYVAATAGGVVFGAALFCTYGVALLVAPMLAVAVYRRAWRQLALAGVATVVTLALPALWGFSWLAGLAETRIQYAESIAHIRGYRYWLLGNAAIYAALIGPAIVVGLVRLRGTAARVLVFGGLACVAAAGLSGLSSAETERIWQPFVPLVLLAGGALWVHEGRVDGKDMTGFDIAAARRWLALQAIVAITFQAVLWTGV